MSSNPDSVSTGEEFTASIGGTGASSKHPQAGWGDPARELKHQPGRNVPPENQVEILPKGTHLPPDRTFLPQNPEYDVPGEDREGVTGQGMTNDEIQDTFVGSTSKDVYSGMGIPGDQSGAHAAALGDGGGKKSGGGVAKWGEGEMLAEDKAKQYRAEAEGYVGNSREEKEYRNETSYGGPRKGNRGPGAQTQ
jgi:hypothetical protein